jgi:hypothetical protein
MDVTIGTVNIAFSGMNVAIGGRVRNALRGSFTAASVLITVLSGRGEGGMTTPGVVKSATTAFTICSRKYAGSADGFNTIESNADAPGN